MIDKIIEKVKSLCSWLSFLLVILITVDVFLRYVFNFSSASLYELEWHFFAAIFLLGSSVTLQNDEHVRVDVFYNRLSKKNKEVINLIGNIFFLVPFSLVIFYTSIPFVTDSFVILESSPDPGGLPFRFIIKSIIPFSFFLLATIGVINITKNVKNISNG
ncbi:MAG: TRAP transporter small permease subunit [Bacteroidota bacterium]|nr:TRAP transporter small permease subunit [Bacteroidota bacterium]|tara:strand:+ start:301 stop:780 length:480 start_codon:yes stop_codon:yes gene_type:complete